MCLITHQRTLTHDVLKPALTVLVVLPAPQKVNNSCFLKYIWALHCCTFFPIVFFLPSLLSAPFPFSPLPDAAFSMPIISGSKKTSLQTGRTGYLGIHIVLLQPQSCWQVSLTRRWCSRTIQCVFCTVSHALAASGVNKREGETTKGY